MNNEKILEYRVELQAVLKKMGIEESIIIAEVPGRIKIIVMPSALFMKSDTLLRLKECITDILGYEDNFQTYI